MTKIKDSGNRRSFETGAVRDIQEGKGRCDLMPLDIIAIVGKNDKILYSIHNFKKTGDHKLLIDILTDNCTKNGTVYTDGSTMFLELAKHFEEGAKKYGENNWQKGIPTRCYVDSAVRHYLKYRRGDDNEAHDRAFIWNIVCCIWTCIHKPELNDYGIYNGIKIIKV